MLQQTIWRLRERRRAGERANFVVEAGFTLIELLIVIVILGILATIVVFSVKGITDKGETSACKAEKATLETAIEAHYAKTGSYAGGAGALVGEFLRDPPAHYGTDSTGAVTGSCP